MRVEGGRRRVAILAVVIALPWAVHAGDAEWLRGHYDASFQGRRCSLDVDARSGFNLHCRGGLSSGGFIQRVGTGVVFDTGRSVAAMQEYLEEFSAAARLHAQQELKDHGYYPVVVPSTIPEEPGRPSGAFVPVVAGKRLYLVNLFQRDAFCAAVTSGRTPPVTGEYYVFRSRQHGTWPDALATDAFCDRRWTFSFR